MRKKTGGRDFKLGNPGGKGRPPVPVELKEARKLSRADVEALVYKYKRMNQAELKTLTENPSTPAEDMIIARVLLRGIAKGDFAILAFLTDFLFGKRPESVHITSVNQTINTNIEVSDMVKNPEILDDLIKIESKIKTFRLLPE